MPLRELVERYLPLVYSAALRQVGGNRQMAEDVAQHVFTELARIGALATLAVVAIALAAYPLAYARRVRALVVGTGSRSMRNLAAAPVNGLLHATVVRSPVRRAVFHFIGQTLMRVPRYRIYLVLYGGVGLSVVTASVLRFSIDGPHLRVGISADGIPAAAGPGSPRRGGYRCNTARSDCLTDLVDASTAVGS